MYGDSATWLASGAPVFVKDLRVKCEPALSSELAISSPMRPPLNALGEPFKNSASVQHISKNSQIPFSCWALRSPAPGPTLSTQSCQSAGILSPSALQVRRHFKSAGITNHQSFMSAGISFRRQLKPGQFNGESLEILILLRYSADISASGRDASSSCGLDSAGMAIVSFRTFACVH